MTHFAFYIQEIDGKRFIRYAIGENPMMKPSEAKELIPILQKYIEENTNEDIERENERLSARFYEEMNQTPKPKDTSWAGGYVYLFECGGKYKIGVSNNVDRRIKDLDHRPFKVTLISKVHSKMAYKVEGTIHARLKKHKIEGEWYDFPTTPTAEWFESLVKRVEDDIRRTKYD